MTLNKLREALREGHTPYQLGATIIGNGIYRTAYRIGDWVVKESMENEPAYKRELKEKFGASLRFPPEVTVEAEAGERIGRVWTIQRYYKPIGFDLKEHERFRESPAWHVHDGDIHWGNLGKDHRGRFVAFDY